MRSLALLIVLMAIGVAVAGCTSSPKQSTGDGTGDQVDGTFNVTNSTNSTNTTMSNSTVGPSGNSSSSG